MSDTGAILELAGRLGDLIAANKRFRALRDAEEAVHGDEAARKLSDELNAQMEKVAELEAESRPIEPEDKHRLEDLRVQVHANDRLQALARAQADYMELMARVNEAIRRKLIGGETDETK